ncbi:hypothetical protein JCM1840_003934 [Sporobolomyces johnsonii]
MPRWRPARSAPLLQLALLVPRLVRVYAAPAAVAMVGSGIMMEKSDSWVGSAWEHESAPETPPGSEAFWWKLFLSAILVLLGGVFAGLTLGLMGLDLVNLQVLSTSGTEQEQRDAAKVMKLLERGRHWVLVVLLLSNVVVNESLPIFLDSILGGGVAVCARYGLRIGAVAAPFVLALMYLEYPIAYPIAKLLDRLLGEEQGTLYKKAELKTFVGLHRQFGEETLNDDEATIISSVLELNDKSVASIMTPLEDIYSLPSDTKLNHAVVDQILVSGHSRIPVHSPGDSTDFVGMLIVKKLISYDPEDEKVLGDMSLSVLPEVGPDATCLDILNYFQQGRSHILLVSKTPGESGGAIGVVSLEDVIEEMIGEEIVDETDLYVDIHTKTKVIRTPARKPAAGKLAPLIAGVIERRRQARRNNTADYTPEAAATPDGRSAAPPTGFDKVKLRGGGIPERRVASGATTPRMDQVSPPDDQSGPNGGERQPLLGGNGGKKT